MNFKGKKSEEEKYFYLFRCTKKRKKMALARDPAGVRPRCAGLPRASGHYGRHLPVSRSCFLVLGIGALGVTAGVRADLTF